MFFYMILLSIIQDTLIESTVVTPEEDKVIGVWAMINRSQLFQSINYRRIAKQIIPKYLYLLDQITNQINLKRQLLPESIGQSQFNLYMKDYINTEKN